MFHVFDGLYFERRDRCVRILKKDGAKDGSPILFDVLLDTNDWASVIATMSFYGEEDYGFYRALDFHVNQPPTEAIAAEIAKAMEKHNPKIDDEETAEITIKENSDAT